MDGAQQLIERFNSFETAVKDIAGNTKTSFSEVKARLMDLEQKAVSAGGFHSGSSCAPDTWGDAVIGNDGFKYYRDNGARGIFRMAVKAISSAADSAGALIRPDRQREVILQPRIRPTIRTLLAPGTTTGNAIEFMREKVVVNNAAVVPEMALKPESSITYELQISKVVTIAHWIPVSRQAMDDSEQLKSLINGSLIAGLDAEEELQMLLGAGTGDNLLGLVPAATPYDTTANATGDNPADTILRAIGQAEAASQLPMTGIVVNSTDWSNMIGLKDGDGRYLGGGPFGTTMPRLWGRPIIDTPNMPAGTFLVLNGTQAAQIFDRMESEVLISQDHADFFVRNLLAVRGERRLAMVIRRNQALCAGSFPA